jgi:GTP:adenosylcobinamide-phosphate guanylyltransferase
MKMHKKRKDFMKIQQDIRSICKRADATSLLHLSIAISENYKYFATSDRSILRHAKQLAKKYKIDVCKSLYDVNNTEDLRKVAFENGIYI